MVFAVSVTIPGVSQSPLRPAIAVPYLLVCPGYVTVSALIPHGDTGASGTDAPQIGWWLRLLLSLGLSALVVPSTGYLLVVTDVGFAPVVATGAVSAFVLSVAAIALVRRRLLDPEERYAVPVTDLRPGALRRAIGVSDRVDLAVNIVLALSVLFLVSSLTFAGGTPRASEQYTELYVLTGGDPTAGPTQAYPSDVTVARNETVRVGVENQEHEPQQYVLVVAYHVRTEAGDGPPDRTELDRFTVSLEHGETWSRSYEVPAALPDRPVELEFRLFRPGGSESEPYRDTHLLLGNGSQRGAVTRGERMSTPEQQFLG